MSSMMPQAPQGEAPDTSGVDIQAILAQLGGGGQGGPPPGPPSGAPAGGGDWLVAAINAVHEGMVQESDPNQVSLLGAIINQLTTFQANQAKPKAPAGG